MKITILVDNNTLIDKYFIAEPAVSFLLEDDGKQILFDVGYSDAFIKNSQKLGKNLLDIDYIVISHGHLDHMWGLDPLLKLYSEGFNNNVNNQVPTITSHKYTFNFRPRDYLGGSGSLISKDRISKFFPIKEIAKPFWVTKNLVCLPEIPLENDFECKVPYKKIQKDNNVEDDYVLDEISLAYKTEKGIVIITSCGHRGICNTIDFAKKVCKDDRVIDVIGGFHLQNPNEKQLEGTKQYFKLLKSSNIHPCHCVDLNSKIELSKVIKIDEVGVGLELEY